MKKSQQELDKSLKDFVTQNKNIIFKNRIPNIENIELYDTDNDPFSYQYDFSNYMCPFDLVDDFENPTYVFELKNRSTTLDLSGNYIKKPGAVNTSVRDYGHQMLINKYYTMHKYLELKKHSLVSSNCYFVTCFSDGIMCNTLANIDDKLSYICYKNIGLKESIEFVYIRSVYSMQAQSSKYTKEYIEAVKEKLNGQYAELPTMLNKPVRCDELEHKVLIYRATEAGSTKEEYLHDGSPFKVTVNMAPQYITDQNWNLQEVNTKFVSDKEMLSQLF